jgi:hypothetical protein
MISDKLTYIPLFLCLIISRTEGVIAEGIFVSPSVNTFYRQNQLTDFYCIRNEEL